MKSNSLKESIQEVCIDSLANSGDGVGRINDKVIFVPFSCPGDKLKVKIIQDKKTFAKGQIVEVIEASSARTPPLCTAFGKCGGCDWQHIQYEEQLLWKKQNLQETLKRIGGLEDLPIAETQPSPQTFHYRNRIQLHFDQRGPFYFQKGTKKSLHIKNCPIASEPINEFLQSQSIKVKGKPQKIELAENEKQKVDIFHVNDKGQSELGFRQVNTRQNQYLIDQIVDLIEKEKMSSAIDLYCGQGNWSLAITQQHPDIQCLGIDNNPINIKKAQKKANPRTQFLLGDVAERIPEWSQSTDLMIIDPPRAGCDPLVLDQLNTHPSPWLVYVSCHPATMARDLKTLIGGNWSPFHIQPVDMFPQTAHLETLAILRNKKPGKDC